MPARNLKLDLYLKKASIVLLLMILVLGVSAKTISAQTSPSVLYIPLIGLTAVPSPLALPNGEGRVTYKYAVKNFLNELPINNVSIIDDTCLPVNYSEGDDNNNNLLDANETWRYTCSTILSQTTQSKATVTGYANNITATHKAYTTVVVGSDTPPPLISIINVTKVAYPLSLPPEGGPIIFTYKVNNPGVVPLTNVIVTDEKCLNMSGKLGDTNGNNLLDIHEVWIYTCPTVLKETTTNTVHVSAFANGLKAVGDATITVEVATPKFPNAGETIGNDTTTSLKITLWAILSGIVVLSLIVLLFKPKGKRGKK